MENHKSGFIFKLILPLLVLFLSLFTFTAFSQVNPLTMTFVGDILLDSSYLPDTNYPFKYVEEELKKSDITAGNLECPISSRGYPNPGKSPEAVSSGRDYIFRASPEMGKSLSMAGFDVLTLANNHSMDYGDSALLDTMDFLKKEKIERIGAGRNINDATKPCFIKVKGVTVGFLGYSEIIPCGYGATKDYPGIAPARMDYYGSTFDEDIKSAKEKSDILVVFFHWGVERNLYADYGQKELAHRAVDMGADLVIGSHPHVLQGIEKYKGGLIAYSLGNFVFDSWSDVARETVILKCSFEGRKLTAAELIPVYIDSGKPCPAAGERKIRILDTMRELTSGLGSGIERERAFSRLQS